MTFLLFVSLADHMPEMLTCGYTVKLKCEHKFVIHMCLSFCLCECHLTHF